MYARKHMIVLPILISSLVLSSAVVYAIEDEDPIDDEIVFEARGTSEALAQFYEVFRERYRTMGALSKLCKQPRQLKDPRTLVFTCVGENASFTEVGAVFLAATYAVPHRSNLVLASSAPIEAAVGLRHCTVDGSTDCVCYGSPSNCGYYHRRLYPSHPCVQ